MLASDNVGTIARTNRLESRGFVDYDKGLTNLAFSSPRCKQSN